MLKVSDTLNYVFNNKNFLEEVIESEFFSEKQIIDALANTLFYYLVTEDSNTKLSYAQIYAEVEYLYSQKIPASDLKKVITKSFLTHSFNGWEKELVAKYGLNFEALCSFDEQSLINKNYEALNFLEEHINRSIYLSPCVLDKIFLTLPGTKTFHYLLNKSPERLYYGPCYQGVGKKAPIIVGEAKSVYYEKVILKEALQKYSSDYAMQEKVKETVKIVTSTFCSCDPCFALIPLREIELWGELDSAQKYSDFYTWLSGDYNERLSDFSIEKTKLNLVQNLDIVQMPCLYKLKQLYAKMHNFADGQALAYHTCYQLSKVRALQNK